jgi:hypothetical protein
VINILSWLGYGDSLITGSIIENGLQPRVGVRLVGTTLSDEVWSILMQPFQSDEILFSNMPSFYSLRKSSLKSVIHDYSTARDWMLHNTKRSDTVVFEKSRDLRNIMITRGLGINVVEIVRRDGAYIDRAKALSPYFGLHQWHQSAQVSRQVGHILINPSARSLRREIPKHALDVILRAARINSVSVSLIDYDGRFSGYMGIVDSYILSPCLSDAANLLKTADLYVGPDSFFTHLAYYFRIPQVGFFWKDNVYFEPPGLNKSGGVYYYDEINDDLKLFNKIDALLNGV